jgi:hypothetical protein
VVVRERSLSGRWRTTSHTLGGEDQRHATTPADAALVGVAGEVAQFARQLAQAVLCKPRSTIAGLEPGLPRIQRDGATGTMTPMETGKRPSRLIPRYTTDAGEYLDRVGVFLRRRPVEHSALLSTAGTRVGEEVAGAGSNLWLWVEDDAEVVATAQHTPPRGAYLSTGPAEAMRTLARTLWQLRTGLAGVAGLGASPQEFATEWSRLGGPRATQVMGQGLYVADAVSIPSGIPGLLRLATDGDAPLLRGWADQFWAEAGARSSSDDEVGPRIAAGLLFVWEVDGAVVSMAAVTVAQGGVSRADSSTPLQRTASKVSRAPALHH